MKYIGKSYDKGVVVSTKKFTAVTDEAAVRMSERLFPGAKAIGLKKEA